MKKNFLILAAAALTFAACSSDETLSTNEAALDANVIGFRSFVNSASRAAINPGVMLNFATGNKFNVYANYYNGSSNVKYFQEDFEKQDGSTFTSVNKYYWPADLGTGDPAKTMTFTAIYGATQKADNPGVIDDYTPATAAASQVDVLVAKKAVTANPGATGVELEFRHALSQVVVKVKNTEPNLKISISEMRIGKIKTVGDFSYSGDGTGKVSQGDWTPDTEGSYTQTSLGVTFTGTNGGTSDNEVKTLGSPWLIVPQVKVATQEYSSANSSAPSITASTEPTIVGNYLALKMVIKNNSANEEVIASERWCCWPISQDFAPGYKYIFLIDAGTGGYQPVDINNEKTDLDTVLGSPIVFAATCSIVPWDTYDGDGDSTADADGDSDNTNDPINIGM